MEGVGEEEDNHELRSANQAISAGHDEDTHS